MPSEEARRAVRVSPGAEINPKADLRCAFCGEWYERNAEGSTSRRCPRCGKDFRDARERKREQEIEYLIEDALDGDVAAIRECERKNIDWREKAPKEEKVPECSGCMRTIIWAETTNGKPIPIDPDPVEGGNVELDQREGKDPLARVVAAHYDEKRYVSHFATCPHRERFKGR